MSHYLPLILALIHSLNGMRSETRTETQRSAEKNVDRFPFGAERDLYVRIEKGRGGEFLSRRCIFAWARS